MSAPSQTRRSLLDHPTHRQLDELDALMQRMLALPVDEPHEAAEIAAASLHLAAPPVHFQDRTADNSKVRDEPSLVDTGADQDTLLVARAEDRSQVVMTSIPTAPSPLSAWESPMATEPLPGIEEPLPGSSPFAFGQADSGQVKEIAKQPLLRESEGDRVPVSVLLLPFVWSNEAFDILTYVLGPVGRWLRAPGGRAILGGSGFLLLIAATVWVVLDMLEFDVMGWSR